MALGPPESPSRFRFLRWARIVFVAVSCTGSLSWSADVLAGLKPQHPRILASAEDFERTRAWIASDSLASKVHASLVRKAERILAEPPLEYTLDPTPQQRLLSVSREALARISLLAGLYRLDGEARYREGALAVMKSVIAFPDWHPPHFLDVAEMTLAVALGYDWLYAEIPPADRDFIRAALVAFGLSPGWRAYTTGQDGWWVHATSNWNQVCNGGMVAGALAIADEEPALARDILDSALASVPRAMEASYGPDGGFPEGLGYWTYGTTYNVYLIASLQSALGSDFGLLRSPGFDRTPQYRMQMVGPTGWTFNYSDQSANNIFASCMFWFAKVFDRPFYARYEIQTPGTPDLFAHLWYDPILAARVDSSSLPSGVRYEKIDVAVMRSSWTDSGAWYVGFKAGNARASHAHLDHGSFVLDHAGTRWAADPGSDSYGVPNYFVDMGSQQGDHWKMYRTRTEGHNTLTISASPQEPMRFASQSIEAESPLIGFRSGGDGAYAIADLTSAYAPLSDDGRRVSRVWRGVRLWADSQFLVQDEIVPQGSVDVVWNLLTEARVELQGSRAVLERGGRRMVAQILSPPTAVFDSVTCHPPDARTPDQISAGALAENPNTSFTKLVVRLGETASPRTLAVRFHPRESSPSAPGIVPLSDWMSDSVNRAVGRDGIASPRLGGMADGRLEISWPEVSPGFLMERFGGDGRLLETARSAGGTLAAPGDPPGVTVLRLSGGGRVFQVVRVGLFPGR
ncbi:MAG: heparinase II/III family protein [Fibrobacteria bacterium]|nr:heparinase II/III family protein [Fibrobacteria bacterium]